VTTASVNTLRFVLGNQLSEGLSSLADIDRDTDVVLMAEVMDECTYVRHHPKKIVFILSAMRHFAEQLRASGVSVDYRALDGDEPADSLRGALKAACRRHRPRRIVVTEPGEWRVLEDMRGWADATAVPVDIRDDDRFLCGHEMFRRWAGGRKQLRMEYFYRDMRRRTGILVDRDGKPEGDRWNFDASNRKALPAGARPPAPETIAPDTITQAVIAVVRDRFASHFGAIEPFGFAVTAEDAARLFDAFVERALPLFGDYQDAMRTGEATLYHSVCSLYLNAGLLDPLVLCQRVEAAYRSGDVPLNAAEGFIRQLLGWREYVRGVYWLKMPAYVETNFFEAHRPLPEFYWTADTDMACVRACVTQTRDNAYAHHIQRLMVTGNFALLAGIEPSHVCEWYLEVYADAYEWVELPNTHGMALFADGGVLASKPYAASGKYINRMSDYCRHCRYDVKATEGPDACPFNLLYWFFLDAHRKRLAGNRRMTLIYRSLDRMAPERLERIRSEAGRFLDRVAPVPTGDASSNPDA
jgi:deoxyribodipyrimidine photolyase-related protein